MCRTVFKEAFRRTRRCFSFFFFPSSVHVFSQYCFSQQILFANMQNLHDGLRSGYKHVLLPTSICKVHGATHWMHLLLLPSLHLTVSHQYCYSGSSERLPGFFRATQWGPFQAAICLMLVIQQNCRSKSQLLYLPTSSGWLGSGKSSNSVGGCGEEAWNQKLFGNTLLSLPEPKVFRLPEGRNCEG